jgi:hypothetical protein
MRFRQGAPRAEMGRSGAGGSDLIRVPAEIAYHPSHNSCEKCGGFVDDTLIHFWNDLVGRLTGPMTFRLILQPLMSSLNAVRDGVNDAREGRPPYFWAIFTDNDNAVQYLRQGFASVGRVILLGLVMDAVYQLIVFRWIYPMELVIVVLLLAFVPYLFLRGPVNRVARWWTGRKLPTHTA